MKTILKYEIEPKEIQTISLPRQAKILTVGCVKDSLYLWALIDLDNNTNEDRIIRVLGTGWTLGVEEDRTYIGTAQMNGGKLIWHVFEVNK